MDVAISELRANLREWVDQARAGQDVVVTERGVPVARLVAVDAAGVLERLERDGVVSRPAAASRPVARHRRRVAAKGSVSDLVADLRR
ncbi:MAG TPA: type II toxin-antitoxin system prevent-host-death family antitoxin [Acidimicrobiales bacterium]|nr:type II toxin-antitoxin system prevent-host-death family antitoxin [Acidimicrobiales bacterium]